MTEEDETLKTRFRELRRLEERNVPNFRSVLDREVRASERDVRRVGWRPNLVFAAAAALVLLFWVARDRLPNPAEIEPATVATSVPMNSVTPGDDPSTDISVEEPLIGGPQDGGPPVAGPFAIGQWAMPTDVLLDLSSLPGDEILHRIPEIGSVPTQGLDGASTTSSKSDRRISA